MKKVIIVQLFLLGLVACEKQELTTVADGKVLAINSNLPIADVTVHLSLIDYTKVVSFGSSAPSKLVSTTQTDKNGHYQFAITPPNEGFAYRVSVPINPNGTSYDVASTSASIPQYGGTSINDFFIKPFGWLKIHLKNMSPFDANDEVIFTNLTLGTFKGQEDRIILAKSRGDSTYEQSLGIKVIKNKIENFKYFNFRTSSNDTTKMDVFY